jgi:hypothetical protein
VPVKLHAGASSAHRRARGRRSGRLPPLDPPDCGRGPYTFKRVNIKNKIGRGARSLNLPKWFNSHTYLPHFGRGRLWGQQLRLRQWSGGVRARPCSGLRAQHQPAPSQADAHLPPAPETLGPALSDSAPKIHITLLVIDYRLQRYDRGIITSARHQTGRQPSHTHTAPHTAVQTLRVRIPLAPIGRFSEIGAPLAFRSKKPSKDTRSSVVRDRPRLEPLRVHRPRAA